MNDQMHNAGFLLLAAVITVAIAFVANLVILAARPATTKAKAKARAKAKADVDEHGELALATTGKTKAQATKSAPAKARQPSWGLAAYATGFTAIGFVLVTVYLAIRWSVAGHGPFSNQHEFAVSFVWGILLCYLVAEWKVKIRVLSVAILPVAGLLTLYSMRQDASVKPLVPALQDSLLLTVHVGFAIFAYGAAAVSFGAAVLYLLRPRIGRFVKAPQDKLEDIGYKAAVVTFPLLTVMIALGSYWADQAWGSYWSWDPKETAALVSWLIYGGYLHARAVRGWRGRKVAWLLVIGFGAILFAYFGNHFFGGLHSYGS
ncbi:MAG: c-type cytochrome biogenesis protein CcsB [Micrococcales bacterium]|nr:c-type cytochrome biogenesis protein CcsB [Micrococcales bacterium]